MAGSKSTYEFKDGDIFRRGDLVGQYDPDTNVITSLNPSLPPQIRSILTNKLAGLKARGKPLVEVFKNETQTCVELQTENCEFASNQAPPPPAMDPKFGDKTPAYIAWMWEHKPKEAAERYKGRKVSLEAASNIGEDVPKISMDEPEEEWK
jgi:hypothetical protein